ncbi:hypothetical protein LAZ67_11002413 [Cordylochernes scorpioides]|uniref:Uncharacterized protein n=1 Tax=Cordylochernes scorpioides TaxID=51811 RepID=A0ABY6KZ80_9ARAC|nr:hypothetical protein LAZ67_11002413 [Cordylochernes scorpioides]
MFVRQTFTRKPKRREEFRSSKNQYAWLPMTFCLAVTRMLIGSDVIVVVTWDLTLLIGTNRIRTTAYNHAANGLVERLHRQIKVAIMASGNTINWIDALPLVLLGIRTSYKEDLKCTAAEMVFGTTLNLPADLLTNSEFKNPDSSNFATQLKNYMMVSRSSKTFTVKINDQDKVISVNRLKPAFLENTPQSFHDSSILSPMPYSAEETTPKTSSYTTRYGRHLLLLKQFLIWFNEFKFVKTNFEDEPRSGRPPTAVTQEKIELVRILVREYRRITYQQLEKSVNIGSAVINNIISDHLNYRKHESCEGLAGQHHRPLILCHFQIKNTIHIS